MGRKMEKDDQRLSLSSDVGDNRNANKFDHTILLMLGSLRCLELQSFFQEPSMNQQFAMDNGPNRNRFDFPSYN